MLTWKELIAVSICLWNLEELTAILDKIKRNY